jgi:hypothetical protein
MIMLKKKIRKQHVSMDDRQLKQIYKKENIPGDGENRVKIHKLEEKYGLKNFTGNPFLTANLEEEVSDLKSVSCTPIPVEYIDDIFNTLLDEQVIIGDCLVSQTDVTAKMRVILINWLYEVHTKFKLRDDTLFFAINILDRYLCLKPVERTNFQLIGTVCLWIASKYEEVYFPEIRDLEYICDKTYKREDYLAAENEVLSTIGFSITPVTGIRILALVDYYYNLTPVERNFTAMVCELCLFEYQTNFFTPSVVVATGLYIIKTILGNRCQKLDEIFKSLRISDNDIRYCRNLVCMLLDNINANYLLPIRNKYARKEFNEVSEFNKLKLI